MEKRIFLAVLVSLAVLYLWAAIAPRLFPDLVKKPAATTTSTTGTTGTTASAPAPASAPGASNTTVAPAAQPAVTASAAPPVTPAAATSVAVTTVDTPSFVARFSNRGAQLVSFQLKNFKTKNGGLVELVKARSADRTDFPFAIQAGNAAVARQLNTALYVLNDRTDGKTRVLEYHYAGNGVSATKTFRFTDEYLFPFTVAVTPVMPYRIEIGPGLRTLEAEERDSRMVMTGNGVYQREDSLKELNREKGGDRFTAFDNAQFIGVEDNYFLTVLKPEKSASEILRRVELPAETGKESRKELYAGLSATKEGVIAGAAYFGPKTANVLDRYGFERTLRFGVVGFIARFFLAALLWINKYTKNFGFAIIVLTIIIKAVLYPLQHKWIVSMKKMQKLQPKQEAIKARYKKARTDPEQRNKMNVEMMKLYQQEGINPAGGCLPMLIQFPIFIGFYNLLAHSIELRGAPFILWIHDLSTKDPYYLLPLLMTIAMFIQQWMTPSTADPAQRRMFMFVPIVFGFFFKEFAAGLVLYWLVQNVLTIVQQMIMNKWWKDHPDDPNAKLKTAAA
jgi:YidC/Oxa1 family membrane protein insertase